MCLRDGLFFCYANDIKLMVLVADIVMHFFRALLPFTNVTHYTSSYITPICVAYTAIRPYIYTRGREVGGDGYGWIALHVSCN